MSKSTFLKIFEEKMGKLIEIENFCKNMRNLRESNKLSKKEMAHKLKVSVTTISKIEKGTIPPRLSCNILFRIHDEFGIMPGILLDRLQNFKK